LALAEVDHARVLARPLQHALAFARQALQEARRALGAAVLRPEQRGDRQLEAVRVTVEQLADSRVLEVGEAERLVQRLIGDPRQDAESSDLTGQGKRTF